MDKGSLGDKLYALVSENGTPIGNQFLHNQLSDSMRGDGTEAAYLPRAMLWSPPASWSRPGLLRVPYI